MKLRTVASATALCALLVLPSTLRAQETVLAGTVTDTTDAVLPGVTVTAVHVDSGNAFVGVTGPSGEFRIGALRTGVYNITAELPGFSAVKRDNLELLLGQYAVVNFKLSVSTVQESVTVTGQSPLIDVTQSKLSGNIDTRQLQELPVNGRNWMDLVMLAPGSRTNAVTESPLGTTVGGTGFQLNLDGQQVTNMVTASTYGNPRFSRDAIAEFEFITNRFDATQGRSMGVQVNAVTKSGTNRFSGSQSAYFRDDRFNAEDFIVHRVLPYEDQQVSTTFGGPIKKDKIHFFVNYEYEREPQSYTFTSPFPRFNIAPLKGARIEHKGGVKLDTQFNSGTRLMVRGYRYTNYQPFDPRNTGGGASHPSRADWVRRSSDQGFATLTQVFGSRVVHEIKTGYNGFLFATDGNVPFTPTILLRGYQIGKNAVDPHHVIEDRYSVRDDLTFLLTGRGRHELKIGGEAMYNRSSIEWYQARDGIIDATGGPIPRNIEDLFPVWNDISTWNLAGLSPVTLRVRQSFGGHYLVDPKKIGAAWVQENWTVNKRLTLNLGLRYDVSIGALGEDYIFPPFLPTKRPSDTLNLQPRLGFAYALQDGKTVIRGGWGKYFGEMTDNPNHATAISILRVIPETLNDGRPNFTADPYNGRPPTYEQVVASGVRRDTASLITNPDYHTTYSYQGSIGLARQLGQTMSFEADYAYAGSRRDQSSRNQNLTYNPATGANYPFSDFSRRLYPDWGYISTFYTDAWSDYHGLQTSFTKRFSNHWQASATYTLSALWNSQGAPNVGFPLAPDVGSEYTLAENDQRHRAVFNGIWQLPYAFQLSGLYFFGSGQRFATPYGADLRDTGGTVGRLRPDGTIVPRNNFVGRPLHRVDLRVLRQFPIHGSLKVDGIFEVFNVFNHANYGSYVTVESSRIYGQPQQNTNVAYQPRTLQLGFRLVF